MKHLLFLLFLQTAFLSFSQRGKNGSQTISTPDLIVNAYTSVTANATANGINNSVTVSNATLVNGPYLTTPLTQGDLVLIVQMQGASMNIDPTPTTSWGGNYTVAASNLWSFDWLQFPHLFGNVTLYNNAGKYEQREVDTVIGNTIYFTCPLQNSYTASGRVQVVRIPRFNNLTINTNNGITCPAWNGVTGGITAIEVNGNLVINANARIHANARGFRGAVADNVGQGGTNTTHANGAGNGSTEHGSNLSDRGARKGEGIGGYTTEYLAIESPYGRGAAANGGGGGGYQNAGGGGGANVGSGTHTGKGRPDPTYAAFWNLELPGMGTMNAPGGGRGGYSIASNNANEATVGPNNTAWGSCARKEEGGMGGQALAYDQTRLFAGGGGGAGDQDNGQGGPGGNGGGIVFVSCYGNISGTGSIEANGQDGLNSNPTNSALPNAFTGRRGNDGAGGGGGGGMIKILNNNPLPASINLIANGGDGGDQNILFGSLVPAEAAGSGAGGGGGGIAFTSGAPTVQINGGISGSCFINGATNPLINAFPRNGATNGGFGLSNLAAPTYNLTASNQTICSSSSTTLTATLTGTMPAGGSIAWYTSQFGSTVVGTGNTFNTPVLSTTTTYWVGVCPGTFRIPVTVNVGANPVITGPPTITPANCNNTGGAISGLTVSGGTTPYTYSWSNSGGSNLNASNLAAGNYTITVTDNAGCFSTSGPYNVGSTPGPSINATGVSINDENCSQADGSISGLTATGTGLSYSWSNTASTLLNPTGLSANNYTLTVTDVNGCTATAGPFLVNNVGGPTVDNTNISISPELCNGTLGSISGITATGTSLSYSWTNGAGSALNASSLSAGSYTLTITDGSGCSISSGPHVVNYVAGPTIDQTNMVVSSELCNGTLGSITNISASGTGLSYSWTNGGGNNLDATGLSAGSYALTLTDVNGCTASTGTVNVGFVAGPTIDATNIVINPENCGQANGTITGLTASGSGLSYAWSNSGGNALDAVNLTAGNYTLTVTDVNGCTATSGPHNVSSSGGPVLDETNVVVTDELCNGTLGSITGMSATGSGLVYVWSNAGGSAIDANNLTAGNYQLTVTDAGNCITFSSIYAVGYVSGPTIDETNIVLTDANCNQGGTIDGIVANGNGLSYSWTNAAGNAINAQDLQPGNYQLTVTDANGCNALSSIITINGIPAPTLDETNATVSPALCNGTSGSISGLAAAGTNLSYSWTNSSTTVLNPNNLLPGTYTLTVTDDNNCSVTSQPYTILYIGGPVADFEYSPSNPDVDETVVFTNQSSGNIIQSTWTIESNSSNTNDWEYIFSNEGSYPVMLIIVDNNGCTDTTTKVIEVFTDLLIPNVITANQDNVNDNFVIKGLKPQTNIQIFNRWGELIFSSDNYQNDWNGKDMAGNDLTEGVYTYVLKPENGNLYHGFVHLER